MIEKKIVADKFNEFKLATFVRKELGDVPIKEISLEKNPMGERLTIFTSAPGLVIGREGSNIKKLTVTLKKEFKMKNLQIKIGEVEEMFLSAKIVAKRIANDLANFGSQKFKLTGFRTMQNIMRSGAMGVEIRITGKLPSSRSKSWLFQKGYLKKTGYVSDFLVDKAIDKVTLKTGVVGIRVSIMLPNTPLPDKIEYLENVIAPEVVEKIEEQLKEEAKDSKKSEKIAKEEVKAEKKPAKASPKAKKEETKEEVKKE